MWLESFPYDATFYARVVPSYLVIDDPLKGKDLV